MIQFNNGERQISLRNGSHTSRQPLFVRLKAFLKLLGQFSRQYETKFKYSLWLNIYSALWKLFACLHTSKSSGLPVQRSPLRARGIFANYKQIDKALNAAQKPSQSH